MRAGGWLDDLVCGIEFVVYGFALTADIELSVFAQDDERRAFWMSCPVISIRELRDDLHALDGARGVVCRNAPMDGEGGGDALPAELRLDKYRRGLEVGWLYFPVTDPRPLSLGYVESSAGFEPATFPCPLCNRWPCGVQD